MRNKVTIFQIIFFLDVVVNFKLPWKPKRRGNFYGNQVYENKIFLNLVIFK